MSGSPADLSSTTAASTASDSPTPTIVSLKGSNYGGHAPVVGSKVFVLEATTNGYGAVAKSLLSATYANGYTTYKDTDSVVTNGLYYVKTDSTGSFNFTGDYKCDVGQPVYLYAAGGNPSTTPAVTISKAVVSGSAGNYTITFTTGIQLLYQGESVTFTGDSSTFGKYISGQTLAVNSTGLTTTSFQVSVSSLTSGGTTISATTYSGLSVTAAQSAANAPSNLAIAGMAMLGICPSSQNFASGLSFVYMNEVSTVAMSYAMAGFAVDALHIGSSSTNLVGLQNAALNAGVLYSIQGNGPGSTTADGEGHLANSSNPNNSNGTVPQQTINTLANIVANCVDSANTSVGTTPSALAAESPACSGLFLTATSNGVPVSSSVGGSTVPIETATAMINVAHYPAGVNSYATNTIMDSSNPSTLFNLPTGNVPFTPQLAAAPKDWTIALTYKNIPTPTAIAIDAAGDAYIGTSSTTAGFITELSPQGVVAATSTVPVPNLYSIAISPTASGAYTVWATSNSLGSMFKFSSSLATSTPFVTGMADPTSLVIDSSSNVYVANDSNNFPNFNLSEFNSAGTLIHSETNSNFSTTNGMALAANGGVWISNTNNSFGLYPNPSTVANGTNVSPNPSGGFTATDAIAVDSQGNVWVTGKQTGNQSLVRFTSTGTQNSYGVGNNDTTSSGGLNNPVGVAVDGTNASGTFNVWVANNGNGTVSEINSAAPVISSNFSATTLSPSVGYQSGTGVVNAPSAIAVDNSGNVWVTNQGNSTVTEIIGSANPVATPLSAMKPGVEP